MKTSDIKPLTYSDRKTLAFGTTICKTKAVRLQSLKNLYKNVIAAPE